MTILLGMLPILAFAFWVVVMRRSIPLGDIGTASLRLAVMAVAPLWAAWLVLGTEFLSLFNAINRPMLILWWLVPLAGAIAMLRLPRTFAAPPAATARWSFLDYFFMTILLVLVAACGLSAALSAPMNFDSLTYHLPRIIFWAQHHNVAHYSTNNLRQMMMSPYTEFVGLHLMVLTGNDVLVNLIQWFAYILTLVAVSLIARQLGASRAGQILAAILAATIPGMFLEASNSKNDVVEAMWTVIAAYWAMTFLDRAKGVMPRMAMLGIAIGAAVLTKGTGAFFTGPAALVAAVALFRHLRMKALLPLVLMGSVALALNAGHFARNYRQFKKIAGPETKAEGGYVLVNAIKTPPAILSNILRNLAIEAGTPWPAFNTWFDNTINRIHESIGIDPHDDRLTFSSSPYTGVAYHPSEEDRCGSPAHVLLALVSLPLFLIVFRKIRAGRVLLIYALGIGTFVIFCTMLRWQEWNTRLLLPSFCLLAPAIAAIWTASKLLYASPLMAIGILAGVAPTLEHNYRPLWGPGNVFTTPRLQMRFHWMPNDVSNFQQAVRLIASKHPKEIAFATDGNSPDYLLMRLLLDTIKPAPKFEYLNPYIKVQGTTESAPDVIIGKSDSNAMTDPCTHRSFVAVQQNQWFTVMIPGTPDQAMDLPFEGFTVLAGLNPLEGPYPQWDLGQVRWGIFPETRLNIPANDDSARELYMQVRRNDDERQTLMLSLNGQEILHYALNTGFRFETIRVPMALHKGDNLLVIRYAAADHGAWPPERAALFRMLQVRKIPTAPAKTQP